MKDAKYTGSRVVDWGGAVLSVVGMGGIVLGILVWQEGGEYVALLIGLGIIAMLGFAWWLVSRKKRGKATLIDPVLFRSKVFQSGVSGQLMQQIALGGTMIVLPLYLQMVLEYNALQAGLSIAPLSLSMFVVAILAGRRAKGRPANIILLGFILLVAGLGILVPLVPLADSGWWLTIPLIIAGAGLGLLVSQLNNYTLSPDLERARERSGGRQLGRRLVRTVVRPRVRRRHHARDARLHVQRDGRCQHRHPAGRQGADLRDARGGRAADVDDAAERQLEGEPQDVADEVIAINEQARPIALQVALFIPILAGLIGIGNAFRMRRLPDPEPSGNAESVIGG